MSTPRSPYWMCTEGRRRRSRGSSEWHTAQRQPIIGTPTLVPEPSTVIRMDSEAILRSGLLFLRFHLRHCLLALHGLNKAESQLRKCVLHQALLLHRHIAPRLFLQHREQVDGMARNAEIGFGPVLFLAKVKHPEVHLGLRLERENQEFKRRRWKWIFLVTHLNPILTSD